jgi:hypothetical protein
MQLLHALFNKHVSSGGAVCCDNRIAVPAKQAPETSPANGAILANNPAE